MKKLLIAMVCFLYPMIAECVSKQQVMDDAVVIAKQYGVEEALFLALLEQESGFQAYAKRLEPQINSVSVGAAQVLPETALHIKCIVRRQELFVDYKASLRCGALYLSMMIKQFDGNLAKALTAYNAGPENVRKFWPRLKTDFAYSILSLRRKYDGIGHIQESY